MPVRQGGAAPREKVLLVGVRLAGRPAADTEEHLAELSLLTDTAGGAVAGQVVQERTRFDAGTLVGRGKALQIAARVQEEDVETVIFDDELSPAQIRNLEKIFGAKVIDRSALILDIFARRARSREARTQVELAQLQYLLPRLTRRWTHLSRQAGGSIGLRGVGETQLEIDRRLIRRRISRLRRDLARVEQARRERRRSREGIPKVALIGYTNSGKSTLFNALSGGVAAPVEDRLFATLDPLVRRCRAGGSDYVAIDTVGFIRKLPHHLVASFRSTLEETIDADVLVHVVDLTHARYEEQMEVTQTVLGEEGLLDRPCLLVLNKCDRAGDGVKARARRVHPEAVLMSALEGEGVGDLKRAIGAEIRRRGPVRGREAAGAGRKEAAR